MNQINHLDFIKALEEEMKRPDALSLERLEKLNNQNLAELKKLNNGN